MTLKLYFDLMSQPSRTLYILLKNIKCDFTPMRVDLRKARCAKQKFRFPPPSSRKIVYSPREVNKKASNLMFVNLGFASADNYLRSEHYSEAYTNLNRFQKVPVIDHNGFILTESVAILKYLSREGIIPDSLYPKDSKQAARVEEFLEWQHAGLRLHCAMFFRVKALDPMVTGKPADPKNLQGYERRMENALELFSELWLGRGQFIIGDKASVADLLAACEVEQPRMAGYDPTAKYPRIAEWMQRVREHFEPHYAEGHVILNKIVENKSKMAPKL